MLPCRLAALSLAGALAACEAPPPDAPVPLPIPEYRPPVLSAQRVAELSARCAKVAGEQFRRNWSAGPVPTTDGRTNAGFASHYNVKTNTCFYLLAIEHAVDPGDTSTLVRRKLLVDIDDDEPYGEFLGPAYGDTPRLRLPVRCRVEAYFCSSEAEWLVLARPYMEE